MTDKFKPGDIVVGVRNIYAMECEVLGYTDVPGGNADTARMPFVCPKGEGRSFHIYERYLELRSNVSDAEYAELCAKRDALTAGYEYSVEHGWRKAA